MRRVKRAEYGKTKLKILICMLKENDALCVTLTISQHIDDRMRVWVKYMVVNCWLMEICINNWLIIGDFADNQLRSCWVSFSNVQSICGFVALS